MDRANKFTKNKKIDKNMIPGLSERGLAPPVGSYEPDKTLTILYDINKHKKYGNSHFNSTQYSDRNGFYLFQKNAPNGPGSYFSDKLVEKKQISAAFNSTSDRFIIGGKNNTRNLHEVPKKMMDVSMKKNKEGESTLGFTEKIVKESVVEQKSVLSHNKSINYYKYPEKSNLIRGEMIIGGYYLEEISNNLTKCIFINNSDLKISSGISLINKREIENQLNHIKYLIKGCKIWVKG